MSVDVSGGTHDIIYSMITLQVSRRHNQFSHFSICRQNIEAVLLKKSKSFKTSVYKPIKSKEKCRPKLLIMLVSTDYQAPLSQGEGGLRPWRRGDVTLKPQPLDPPSGIYAIQIRWQLGAEVIFWQMCFPLLQNCNLGTWKGDQIVWEAFWVALIVRFWAWPRIQACIRPDPPPPPEA